MSRYVAITALVAIGVLNFSCARAQHTAPRILTDGDIISVMNTADRNDIEGGQLAQARGSDPRVEAYGRRMVADHSAMLEKTDALAQHVDITPVSPPLGQRLKREHDGAMQTLRNTSPKDFGAAYISHEIQMHEQVIKLIKSAVAAADHTALKQHLLQAQSNLHDHLEAARGIERRLDAQSGQFVY